MAVATRSSISHDVVIVGGGACGIAAAISARRQGASVLVCEKMPKLGKKILASGNGRCNLLNDALEASFYNAEARGLVESVLGRFGKEQILNFFKELGLAVYSDKGRIFPVTNQAVSVMEVLELELSRLGVEVQCSCEATGLTGACGEWTVVLKTGKRVGCRRLILCAGGKSYPAFGSDGTAYALAARLGHHLIAPVPSTVPLVVKDPWCHYLQGQRIRAAITSLIDDKCGCRTEGELLFTKYGLSGTAVLDASEAISIALNRSAAKDVRIIVDLLPFMEEDQLRAELTLRLDKKFPSEKLIVGLLAPKFSVMLSEALNSRDAGRIVRQIKHKQFLVSGTRGWNEAEFTAGGIDTGEVDPQTLESKCRPGMYLAGEILNVQGTRGGYNLAWAWASGFVAGQAASGRN